MDCKIMLRLRPRCSMRTLQRKGPLWSPQVAGFHPGTLWSLIARPARAGQGLCDEPWWHQALWPSLALNFPCFIREMRDKARNTVTTLCLSLQWPLTTPSSLQLSQARLSSKLLSHPPPFRSTKVYPSPLLACGCPSSVAAVQGA